jgi:positive regulator of sigma E activity
MLTGDKGLVRARNSDKLQAALCSINDRVEISIRGSTLTKSALTLYGGPLALGLAFAMSQANNSDLCVAGAFFAGLAVGFISLRWMDARGLLGSTEPVLERLVETTLQPVMVVDPTQ